MKRTLLKTGRRPTDSPPSCDKGADKKDASERSLKRPSEPVRIVYQDRELLSRDFGNAPFSVTVRRSQPSTINAT